jgi:uncharacterized protein
MLDMLKETYYRLLRELSITTHRFLFDEFNADSRLTGLIGPRGVGKTTLLLQYIKERLIESDKAFYCSADHIYFNQHSLLELVRGLYEIEGRRFIFIDEIHKYPKWEQELKNIYDSFPRVHVIFSGSSSIDLAHGMYDLSRRAILFRLPGLSFREYLNFECGSSLSPAKFDQIVSKRSLIIEALAGIEALKGHFKTYCSCGYYPFVFEDRLKSAERILAMIEKTIYGDIAHNYQLKTTNLRYFKQCISFLATIPPGELNTHNLASHLGIDHKTAAHYVDILEQTGLTQKVSIAKRGAALVRSPEKMYLSNAALYYSVCAELGLNPNPGTIREVFFVQSLRDARISVHYTKEAGDFVSNGIYFEIGGKNKTKKQILSKAGSAFVVKDDILTGGPSEIPLYLFGFLY